MSAIDPTEIPLLLSTDTEGREAPASGPHLTPADRPRRRGKVREGLVHTVLRNRKAVAGLIILAIFVLVALLAPVLFPGDPSTITSLGAQPPSADHLLGTTPKGQDVLALTVWGARTSLLVGFAVGLTATSIGIVDRAVGRLLREVHRRWPVPADERFPSDSRPCRCSLFSRPSCLRESGP